MAQPTEWQQRALEAAEALVDGDQSLMSKYGFDYAVAFMKAALKLRGWTVAEAAPETRRDVDLMVYRFNRQYTRMLEHGWSPQTSAEALTHQWWDLETLLKWAESPCCAEANQWRLRGQQ